MEHSSFLLILLLLVENTIGANVGHDRGMRVNERQSSVLTREVQGSPEKIETNKRQLNARFPFYKVSGISSKSYVYKAFRTKKPPINSFRTTGSECHCTIHTFSFSKNQCPGSFSSTPPPHAHTF